MLHKSFDIIETKADVEAGTFEATVAVFGNVDKGGDRIMPGAFDKTLAKWRESGDPIPIILSHSWDNPFHHIGVADPNDVTPTTKGLHVKGKLDIADNDVAKQVHRLMQRRSLKEFSFGYSVPKGGEKRAKDGANELLEIDLAEAGPTLKGMNPATELHSVKSALGVEEPKDPAELRKEADRAAREVEKAQIPDVPEQPAETPAEAPAFALESELQEVKAQLAETRQLVEDLKNKADATDKGTKSRSVDPLRQQAEALALEVASDGMSLRPPPKTVEPTRPEPALTLRELKQRTRDEMLGLLSGGTIE